MHTRSRRLAAIRSILATSHPRNQEDFVRLLAREGLDTTQATLSRDLREVGVLKGPDGYFLPTQASALPPHDAPRSLARAVKVAMIEALSACNLIVIRTHAGHASGLALEIDRSGVTGVVGTVAGDDTIFVATTNGRSASRVARTLTDMLRVA